MNDVEKDASLDQLSLPCFLRDVQNRKLTHKVIKSNISKIYGYCDACGSLLSSGSAVSYVKYFSPEKKSWDKVCFCYQCEIGDWSS